MTEQLGIIDLLKPFGFDDHVKTKMVRHQDARYDIPSLISEGWFELYQSLQAKPVFNDCQQIVSFAGDGGTRARFLGVFRVMSEQKARRSLVPTDCPYRQWSKTSRYYYTLERLAEFAALEGRVVIDWGDGAIAWHQYLRNKPIIEVKPPGRLLAPFTDYLDFSLTHAELCNLAASAEAHHDWVASLKAVAGVYLILAETTGHVYVGSAYGTGGIWSRWLQYAATGHGNNDKLKGLLKDRAYPGAFRFSILQVLPKSTTPREVIRWESQYKHKLGSRATGLNLN